MNEPLIHVGILTAETISFRLGTNGGLQTARTDGQNRVVWQGKAYDTLEFSPNEMPGDCFELKDVVIGIGFHWERKEDQRFAGGLKLVAAGGKLTAINLVRVEDYLTSVISSEMSATASLELLKAHAVISRSWLLANVAERLSREPDACPLFRATADARRAAKLLPAEQKDDNELIRWYDNDAHTRFDVCADDHCQRYQGITRACTDRVRQAIAATRGQVLTYGGRICDARFSKCCGGAFEEFQYCWENVRHPYLRFGIDREEMNNGKGKIEDDGKRSPFSLSHFPLTSEAAARRWILTSPPAFCHTTDRSILSQVLNGYDQETADFYRWQVSYSQEELSHLIRERSGTDYGYILDLVPLARGTSGRIWKLRIVGTRLTRTIGKELEIRRTLSPTHLYSSAFVVVKEGSRPDGLPARFILTGAGWGHGVGLCQIGAAMMGEQGYRYNEILLHYYKGAKVETLYS